jgi:hypothetical protein
MWTTPCACAVHVAGVDDQRRGWCPSRFRKIDDETYPEALAAILSIKKPVEAREPEKIGAWIGDRMRKAVRG